MSLAPGSRIGSYHVVALLGAGGMGEVYRARDAKLNRDVAIKVLPATLAGDAERARRFEREAQMLAALSHPNIAAIYSVETAVAGPDGAPPGDALVMELVEGPTLAALLTRAGAPARGLPFTDVLAIARQLVDALDAAHERGIVHRDLKPANVKVRDDGTVKVLDFGLAKALAPDAANAAADMMNSPTLTAPATQLGVILGTAAYMSPEQARGRALDKRTDIWAFGAVLYEMVTGRRAFAGDDVADTLAAVLRHDIDWHALPPDTPSAIRRLLARCLERDLKRRLRDIADAREDLDGAALSAVPADGSAISAAPRASRARVPWAIAGFSVLVAAATGAWALFRTPVAAPGLVTRNEISIPDRAAFPSLSRDGTHLTYTSIGSHGKFQISVRRIDQFAGAPVPGAEGVFPIFSPDGQWLAYAAYGPTLGISRIPISGGAPTSVCDGSTVDGAVWLPDDTIVFAGEHGLMRVRAAGGTPEALTSVDTAHGEIAHGFPAALPDGKHLLFTVSTAAAGKAFAVLDLISHKYQTVAPGGDHGQYVASGHLTFVRGTTLFAVPFDASRFVVTGAEVPVVEGVSTTGNDAADYTVSDSGLLVYKRYQAEVSSLAWIDRKGAVTPLPGSSKGDWDWGRLSPDGTRLAISRGDRVEDVWVVDVARGAATKLTSSGHARVPVWMPDSRRIIFSDRHDGHPALWMASADNSAPPTIVADFTSLVLANAVSPDGRTLFVLATGTSPHSDQIMVVPLDTNGRATAPARSWHERTSTEENADVSPDGRWVAYESAQSGGMDVYVQSSSGTGARVRVSDAGGRVPRWSRSGRELLWTADFATGLEAVDVAPGSVFAPGRPHLVLSDVTTGMWDVTPDPNRFLIAPTVADVAFAVVTNWFDELRRDVPPRK